MRDTDLSDIELSPGDPFGYLGGPRRVIQYLRCGRGAPRRGAVQPFHLPRVPSGAVAAVLCEVRVPERRIEVCWCDATWAILSVQAWGQQPHLLQLVSLRRLEHELELACGASAQDWVRVSPPPRWAARTSLLWSRARAVLSTPVLPAKTAQLDSR